MNGQNTKDFSGSETALYDTIMVYACHCTFAQMTSALNPRIWKFEREDYLEYYR